MRFRRAAAGLLLTALTAAGCSTAEVEPDSAPADSPRPSTPAEPVPTGWGPTEAEVAAAREEVAGWDADRLAGGVIIARYHGYDAAVIADLVTRLDLGGVAITAGNVLDSGDFATDAEHLRELTGTIADAAREDGRTRPPIIGVDQEGGLVQHLRGIATDFPAYAAAGAAIEERPRRGRRAVRRAARAAGLELRDFGFNWVFAPVADVTIGSADPTIGSRSPSSDPGTAARAVRASVTGYRRAGVVSTTKHFPGHGGATSDSHDTMPTLATDLEKLLRRDLRPFRAAVAAGAPAVMLGHLEVTDLDPGTPATLSPATYDLLREEIGFEGVAVTDSMGMGALHGVRDAGVRAINAGADLLLMPIDAEVAHREVSRAVREGRIGRDRIEEAAARVVALQTWQQRRAEERPVPGNVTERAEAASAGLAEAASG